MSWFYVGCTVWTLVGPFLYGYNTAALNQIQGPLTCKGHTATVTPSPSSCVPMSDAMFGVVTSFFTAGGLLGSCVASPFLDRFGRRGVICLNSICVALGSALFATSDSVFGLTLGRLIIGFGCGIGLAAAPLYLAETSPARYKERVGVSLQLSICVGILATQAVGLPLAARNKWRLVLGISSAIAVLHALLTGFVTDTPAWLAAKGRHSQARTVSRRLQSEGDSEVLTTNEPIAPHDDPEDVRVALLTEPGSPDQPLRPSSVVPPTETISIPALLRKAELRRAVLIVGLSMISQQGSGINAVIYYSTDVLRGLTRNAAYISLLVSIVNLFATFVPIMLVKKLGTRRLLMASMGGSIVSLVLLGYGLNGDVVWLSSFSVLAFVASFALGLGPVPFMLSSELVPYYATASLQSFALGLNWTSNFFVGLGFLPLRKLLSKTMKMGEGSVFYVFALITASLLLALLSLYQRHR